jgi:hypothetical protein
MSLTPQSYDGADGLKLADALDRLAGALEQQTRTLLELREDVSGLAGNLRRIETRLDALEAKRPAVPGRDKPKAPGKKRPK